MITTTYLVTRLLVDLQSVCVCSCCAERMKTQLLKPEVRDRIKYLSNEQFGVDAKKRPGAEDVPQASFRKLNVD